MYSHVVVFKFAAYDEEEEKSCRVVFITLYVFLDNKYVLKLIPALSLTLLCPILYESFVD